jgi:hypothetical protein
MATSKQERSSQKEKRYSFRPNRVSDRVSFDPGRDPRNDREWQEKHWRFWQRGSADPLDVSLNRKLNPNPSVLNVD